MIGPKRFVASRGLKADLIASARGDRPSQASRRRALVAAGAAAAATSSTSLAMGSSVVRWVVWKWVAAGLASTVAVVTARTILVPAPQPAPVVTAAAAAPVAQATAPAALAHAVHADDEAKPEIAAPPEPDVGKKTMARTFTTRFTTNSVTRNAVEPARPEPVASPSVPSSSQLASEIATLDQAKHAVKSGDSVRALHILDSYDATFSHGALAPEASALRIEALVRAGRRVEAQNALGAFRSSHPESPLLGVLAGIVGEGS
jgi:hypothetical protein